MRNILISGGSGLVGMALTRQLLSMDYQVAHLSRKKQSVDGVKVWQWDPSEKWIEPGALNHVNTIIHLAGANIGTTKQDEKGKRILTSSRIDTAQLLFSEAQKYKASLKTFISASAIGYYGMVSSDRIFEESDPPGKGFVPELTAEWEKAADQFKSLCRVAKIRVAVVLDKNEGALPKMALPVNFGAGAALGTGKQWVPWIHIQDLVGIFTHIIENSQLEGVFNAVAPEHINNHNLTKAIAKVLNKPFFLPNVPSFLLRFLFKERAALILEGSRVSGKKIIDAGFKFRFEKVEAALKEVYD
ncbi:MAG: TIGR01777 family protein [Flavobacteriales bacterium]|nr:TIGR01777 family protein [Flavobacteriales bacterium]